MTANQSINQLISVRNFRILRFGASGFFFWLLHDTQAMAISCGPILLLPANNIRDGRYGLGYWQPAPIQ